MNQASLIKGQDDLENKIITMVSESNLRDDPLRLLRAYRQASQLHFEIETETKITLRKLAPRLNQVAAERVNRELGYLLASQDHIFWLQLNFHLSKLHSLNLKPCQIKISGKCTQ